MTLDPSIRLLSRLDSPAQSADGRSHHRDELIRPLGDLLPGELQHRPTRRDELVVPSTIVLERDPIVVMPASVDLDGQLQLLHGNVRVTNTAPQSDGWIGRPSRDACLGQVLVGDAFGEAPRTTRNLIRCPARPLLPSTTPTTIQRSGNLAPGLPAATGTLSQQIRLSRSRQVQARPWDRRDPNPIQEVGVAGIEACP